jgi:hypothetical protein
MDHTLQFDEAADLRHVAGSRTVIGLPSIANAQASTRIASSGLRLRIAGMDDFNGDGTTDCELLRWQ